MEVTERLVSSLLKLDEPPKIFAGASAVGYYGDRGDELLKEESAPGHDFLAQLCQRWEKASAILAKAGTRVVHLRFGMILSNQGGALSKMLPAFRLGMGGRLGRGKQWMSWVARTDVVRVIEWVLANDRATGAYNVVAPQPVTNSEFTRALAKVLGRPAVLPVPAVVLRFVFGEAADALLLTSQRAMPHRLLAENFSFQFSSLTEALRGELS